VGRLLAMGLAIAFAGCSPVVEAEFSDIEVTRPGIQILGVGASSQQSVTFTFPIDSGSLGSSTKPEVKQGITAVQLHRLSLTATSGVSDLSFIQSLHALACVPINKSTTVSARQVEIADCVRQPDPPASATFEVPIPEPVDLLPLLRPSSTEPNRILVIVNLGGVAPTVAWTVDISMSLSLKLRQ
jgi:hypothetical protein